MDSRYSWLKMKGRKVLGGRKGGMPEMVFEYILKQNGLDPQKDLSIDQSIDFGATAAAFTGDDSADFTVEFEPSATALEKQGAGYVVASLGVDSGYVPYTSYSAKTSYMEKNPDIMQKFTDALQKGMDYVQSHTPEEIAEVIEPQFPETDLDTITAIVKRYYDQDTWKENLVFGQDGFELLQDILEDAGELTAHCLGDQRSHNRAVHTAGQSQQHLAVANLGTDLLNGSLGIVLHGPVAGGAAHIVQEVPDHGSAVFSQGHFRMELHAIELGSLIVHGSYAEVLKDLTVFIGNCNFHNRISFASFA